MRAIEDHSNLKNSAFFIDPPYTAGTATGKRAGSRLYTHHRLDHEQLFSATQKVKGDFLMTYDDAADDPAPPPQYQMPNTAYFPSLRSLSRRPELNNDNQDDKTSPSDRVVR